MFDLMRGFESHQGEEAEILEWLEGSERLPEHKALLAQYSAVETQFFFYSDCEQFAC
ncbi:hypothetical protein HFO49_31630 [Rhizobium leguminosarum]|uniref:hypothetical protein n=1 Tax=Rhizobium leguminosarum TaxID=384 RepID=UPI001C968E58|nr:hypothetical protein [Rhizobium leguminosarum]MBY5591925.1 hypothetical protein [Rhizobium leguminosarum]